MKQALGNPRPFGRRQRCICLLAIAAAIRPSAALADLIWDATGVNPTSPQGGSGNWDTTTSANWSNGSKDTPWVNGTVAEFPSAAGNPTVTIDDRADTVSVAGIYLPTSNNYTIAAVAGDTLTIAGGTFIGGSGTISAPIVGTGGISLHAFGGPLILTGNSTYTGITTVSDGVDALGNGASLGNTSIYGNQFEVLGSASAGTGGAASAGATLGSATFGPLFRFSMVDGTIGTFTLKEQTGFSGAPIYMNGNGSTVAFDLSNSAADEILVSGPGKASISGVNTINISTASADFLTPNSYTLVSIPGGGLTGTFDFANGLTTESITVGGSPYTLQLTNTDTAEILTVLPEPASAGIFILSGTLLLRRRRRTRS